MWVVTGYASESTETDITVTVTTDTPVILWARWGTCPLPCTPIIKINRGIPTECGCSYSYPRANIAIQDEPGPSFLHTITIPFLDCNTDYCIALIENDLFADGVPAIGPLTIRTAACTAGLLVDHRTRTSIFPFNFFDSMPWDTTVFNNPAFVTHLSTSIVTFHRSGTYRFQASFWIRTHNVRFGDIVHASEHPHTEARVPLPPNLPEDIINVTMNNTAFVDLGIPLAAGAEYFNDQGGDAEDFWELLGLAPFISEAKIFFMD
jgi:hypothetical protein